jgi:hypothetical protein
MDHRYCLPCRRSRVRIPSAALRKACICRPFFVRSRLVRLRRVGLTPDSPRADRLSFQGNALFAGRFWFVRTEVLLRTCRRSGVLPVAAVSPTLAAAARSCGRRPTARYQRSRSLGPVRFQSGNREVDLGPLRDLASHGPQSRELLAGPRPRQRRGAHNGELVPRQSRGSSPRASLPSATRRLRAPGLGSSPSSNASASPTSRETAPFPQEQLCGRHLIADG